MIAGHGAKPIELEDLASALLCSAEEATSAELSSSEQTPEHLAHNRPVHDLTVESFRSADHFLSPHTDVIAAHADTIAASIRDAAAAAYSSSEMDTNHELAVQASIHLTGAAAPSSSSSSSSLDPSHTALVYDSDDDQFSYNFWPSWRQESEWIRQVAEHRACAANTTTAAAAAAAVKASLAAGAIFAWHRIGSRRAQGAARAIQTAYWTYRRRSSRARRERRAALRPIRVAAKKLRIATAAVAASLGSGAIFAWHRNGPGAPTHAALIIQAALRLRMLRPVVVPSPEAPVAPAPPPCRVPSHPWYSLDHSSDHQTQGTHILLVLAAHDAARTIQACQRARGPLASDSDTDTSMPPLASDPPSDCDDGRCAPTQGCGGSLPASPKCRIAHTPPIADPHAAASTIQRAIRALLHLRGGGDSDSESSWGDPAPLVLMGTPVHYSSSSGGGDMRQNSIVLTVPYAHRHVAMALGASWDPCRRLWWAPNEPHWNAVLARYRPRRPNHAEIARGNAPLGKFRSTAPAGSLSSSPDPSTSCADRPPPPPVADGVAQREIRQYFPVSVADPDPPRRPPPPLPLTQPPQTLTQTRTEASYIDLLQDDDHPFTPTITPIASRPPALPASVEDAQRELAKWGERVSPTGEPPPLEWYHTRITQVRLEAHIASMPSPQRYHTSGAAAFSPAMTVMMSPGPSDFAPAPAPPPPPPNTCPTRVYGSLSLPFRPFRPFRQALSAPMLPLSHRR